MPKKQFKSESKRLLDLMINSIYTHREIFLRELISNASDAIDKLCYIALTDDKVGLTRDDFRIDIDIDAENRLLTVSDNGVGMTQEELEQNLGVIAKSGSFQFKKDMDEDAEQNIIGQFGVGFYSAFMVSKKVTVVSRAYGSDVAYKWESSGSDGYTVAETTRETVGTDVIIEIKPDTDDDNYGEFLEEHTIHTLVKKYSDYIRHPIYMDVTRSRRVESEPGEDGKTQTDWEDYTEREVVNSRVPLWQRAKSDVSDEDCFEFYKSAFGQEDDPAAVIRVDAEGAVSYRAMLFIPSRAPYDYYTRDYEPGLKLYASGVMIMEKCSSLLPEYFRFVRGVVDSPDLSLNISRELLQHDRQLRAIASNLERKVRAELMRLLENEREKYETFYAEFALQLKYGLLSEYGAHRETLKDLLLFRSAKEEKLVTLGEYADKMLSDQPYAYYACGENLAVLNALPQAQTVLERGYDVLLMTDDVDDFAASMLGTAGEKELRSVRSGDLGLQSDDEKKAVEETEKEYRELLDYVTEALSGKVAAAKLSPNLKSAPSAIGVQGAVTLEMEKYFSNVRGGGMEDVKAERVLELSAEHPAFGALKTAFETDRDLAVRYAELLYDLAALSAGLELNNIASFTRNVAELIK